MINGQSVRATRSEIRGSQETTSIGTRDFQFQRARRSFPFALPVPARRGMILQLQSERASPLGTHEHNPEIARHRGPIYRGPRTLTPYYRRASGCDRQEDIGALCALRAAKVTGRKEWPAKLYTDRKSRGIIPVRPVAHERVAPRDPIAAPASAVISSRPATVQ